MPLPRRPHTSAHDLTAPARAPPAQAAPNPARGCADAAPPASSCFSAGCARALARRDDLPPDHPRRPRLRVVPDRRREGRRRRCRRPPFRGRRVPRAGPLHGRRHRAHLRDAQPRRPRLRPRPPRRGDRRDDPRPPRRQARLRPRAVRRRRRVRPRRAHGPRASHARPPARAHRLRPDRHRAAARSRGRCSPATPCSSATSRGRTWRSRSTEGARGIFRSLHGRLLLAGRRCRGLARASRRLDVRRTRDGHEDLLDDRLREDAQPDARDRRRGRVRRRRARQHSARSPRTSRRSSSSTAGRSSPTASSCCRSRRARSSRSAGRARSLVDVRTDQQFDDAHIAGAICNPMLRAGFGSKLAWLADREQEIVFIGRDDEDGRHAGRLAVAVGIRKLAGYLHGGMTSWRQERRPAERIERIDVEELRAPPRRRPGAPDPRRARAQRMGRRATSRAPRSRPGMTSPGCPDGLDPQRPIAVSAPPGSAPSTAASLLRASRRRARDPRRRRRRAGLGQARRAAHRRWLTGRAPSRSRRPSGPGCASKSSTRRRCSSTSTGSSATSPASRRLPTRTGSTCARTSRRTSRRRSPACNSRPARSGSRPPRPPRQRSSSTPASRTSSSPTPSSASRNGAGSRASRAGPVSASTSRASSTSAALAAAAREAGATIAAWVDIDTGLHRTGIDHRDLEESPGSRRRPPGRPAPSWPD